MQVTVKLSSREGAAHISGILAGFTLLAKRGKLTLRVQDVRQGNPLARKRCWKPRSTAARWCLT